MLLVFNQYVVSLYYMQNPVLCERHSLDFNEYLGQSPWH